MCKERRMRRSTICSSMMKVHISAPPPDPAACPLNALKSHVSADHTGVKTHEGDRRRPKTCQTTFQPITDEMLGVGGGGSVRVQT